MPAWGVVYEKTDLLFIIYIWRGSQIPVGLAIILGVEKCFGVKDADGVIGGEINCCTVLWLLCICYLNITPFTSCLARGLTLSGNCFITAAIIFPKPSSADCSSVLHAIDFSSFSFTNLDMSSITFISDSLTFDFFGFFVLSLAVFQRKWFPFSLVWQGIKFLFKKVRWFIVNIRHRKFSLFALIFSKIIIIIRAFHHFHERLSLNHLFSPKN